MKLALSSLAEVITGYPQVSKDEIAVNDVPSFPSPQALLPAIGLRAITADGGIDLERLDRVHAPDSSAWHHKLTRSSVRPDDVIVAARGSTGKAGVVRNLPKETSLLCTNNVLIVRPHPDRVMPAYLQAYFQNLYAHPEQDVLRRGMLGQWSITRGDLEQLEIELPPLEEQRRIASAFDSIHEARRAAVALSDHYSLLLGKLSQTYFAGQIRL